MPAQVHGPASGTFSYDLPDKAKSHTLSWDNTRRMRQASMAHLDEALICVMRTPMTSHGICMLPGSTSVRTIGCRAVIGRVVGASCRSPAQHLMKGASEDTTFKILHVRHGG